MEATSNLIDKIQEVKENEVIRLAPNLILWKEGSNYDIEVTKKQFDRLETLLEEQQGNTYYIIDLSLAKRPGPEIVKLVADRLEPIVNRFEHAAVFTGNNYVMYLGIKFYFIRFKFPSYSAHDNFKSVLNSFK